MSTKQKIKVEFLSDQVIKQLARLILDGKITNVPQDSMEMFNCGISPIVIGSIVNDMEFPSDCTLYAILGTQYLDARIVPIQISDWKKAVELYQTIKEELDEKLPPIAIEDLECNWISAAIQKTNTS